ncbi:hypothetical protein PISL3812_01270 [Talaromyces islandicus]|uniref:C2H2-type domain-containing protein n=1 Tax=Talaromyces islandicus TaxID=28573 RepID=A0A0U1LLM8_TALIS|nr:hypothetical protein PISL3812_01270 [Talaromyces islandicus]
MPQERFEKGKRLRACSICGRAFKRTEHCIRHERAHFRERPFSCRFCDKSYGRKDLLVRHERTLHADQWAMAQSATSTNNSSHSRTNHRRRQSRNSWDPAPALPTPVQGYKPEPQNSLFINNETVIQYESFLPSPRVSSSSDISDPEPVNGVSEAFDLDRHLDPSLANPVNMAAGGPDEDGSLHFQSPFQLDSRPYSYESHMSDMQPQEPIQFNYDHGFPLDPSLTMDPPKSDSIPTSSSEPESGNPNFFTLLPGSNTDDQPLLLNQVVTSGNSNDGLATNIFALDVLLSEQRRRGRPPRNSKTRSEPQLPKVMTEETRVFLIADIQERLSIDPKELVIPSLQSLHGFMNTFFKTFNIHLPIFHPPSFDISVTPSSLFLAMCSIGALFDKERDTANHLREIANEVLQTVDSGSSSRSLWEVQCRLLLIVGAAFGGNPAAVAWALENVGFLHREFSWRRSALLTSRETDPENWAVWIERESTKRLLFGIFIISSLLTITYNVSPGISTTDDLKIEMPEPETIWMAADQEHWNEAMTMRVNRPIEINQALTTLLFGKDFNSDLELQWSAFSATILMHAVNVHMWHVTQSTQSFMNFSIDAKAEAQMKELCTNQTEESLSRCHRVLALGHAAGTARPLGSVERTLLFNGMAVLRSCYVRVFTGSGAFNRTTLFCDDREEVLRAARDYVRIQQVRTPFLAKAVTQVFDGLLTPIWQEKQLSKRKDTLGGSIEHAVAAWDCALFYTKWVYTLEMQQEFAPPDHEEKKNLDSLLEILQEVGSHDNGRTSLAASAARMWASFLDDNWTWEVTWRMGNVLRQLASVYENDKRSLGIRS